MTETNIHNRTGFLAKVSASLGREMPTSVKRPTYKNNPQLSVLENCSQDELMAEFKVQAEQNLTKTTITTTKELPAVLADMLQLHGEGSTIIWNDERYAQLGLTEVLKEAYVWDRNKGDENTKVANTAKYAVAFSEISMAETATITHFHTPDRGRVFSFLPENYIAIIPKSSIVPRMTQATMMIHEKVEAGEVLSSCINFICGPSNSADIELSKVIGVHGPLRSSYIVVDDL